MSEQLRDAKILSAAINVTKKEIKKFPEFYLSSINNETD